MNILNKIPSGCGYDGLLNEIADELFDLRESHVNPSLVARPRNCDLYSHDEALRIWNNLPESKENECFDEWLVSEAKGETNG